MMSLNYYDKNIFDLISKIIKKNKYLIISSNNYGLTPFHLASKNKCNDSLYLMSNYFSFDEIETISNKGNAIHYASISNCVSTLR
jgi:ankyrin repeat protein